MIKTLEGCEEQSFFLYIRDQSVGSVKAGTKIPAGAGTYDIQGFSSFGTGPMLKDFVIREGTEMVADFTQNTGLLEIAGYPIDEPARYTDSRNYTISSGVHCVPPGTYELRLWLSSGKATVKVNVKAGEKTRLGPDQLGIISFKSEGNVKINAQVIEPQSNKAVGEFDSSSTSRILMLAGIHKIVLTQPYPGLTYENVEIKAGKETTLKLPD